MEIDEIAINKFNGHRLMLKNKSRNGSHVYEDLDGGGFVQCAPAMLETYSPRTAPFQAVQFCSDLKIKNENQNVLSIKDFMFMSRLEMGTE